MAKMIQIRNVPEALHRRLKARAAEAGLSLSEYLLRELHESAELPTKEEFLERLGRRAPVKPSTPAVEVVREERDSR